MKRILSILIILLVTLAGASTIEAKAKRKSSSRVQTTQTVPKEYDQSGHLLVEGHTFKAKASRGGMIKMTFLSDGDVLMNGKRDGFYWEQEGGSIFLYADDGGCLSGGLDYYNKYIDFYDAESGLTFKAYFVK